jgi:hypothetical protein
MRRRFLFVGLETPPPFRPTAYASESKPGR